MNKLTQRQLRHLRPVIVRVLEPFIGDDGMRDAVRDQVTENNTLMKVLVKEDTDFDALCAAVFNDRKVQKVLREIITALVDEAIQESCYSVKPAR